MIRKYGLIGYPLDHSFSKAYFTEKFRKEGITDAVYENLPLKDIHEFSRLKRKHPDLHGVNVTIPYKESVIRFLDALSEDAREIRAVNTICFCNRTGHIARVGHNTDVTGFRKSLEEHLAQIPERALVLGTGGSSKAVVYVLEKLGVDVTLVSSSGKENAISYENLDEERIVETHLIVNTTPLGMHPETDTCPDIPYAAITTDHLLFDLVYNPEETLFLKKGKAQGARTVNGYRMLVYQAEAAWEIWNR